jgi:hypothetical protein
VSGRVYRASVVRPSDPEHFTLRPKTRFVLLMRPSGIPPASCILARNSLRRSLPYAGWGHDNSFAVHFVGRRRLRDGTRGWRGAVRGRGDRGRRTPACTTPSDSRSLQPRSGGDACDLDEDGTLDVNDVCAETATGELVNPTNGCSLDQLCPCEGARGSSQSWKNQGKYVSCLAHATNDFVALGLIGETEKGSLVSAAAQSSCGSKK